jgi:hypothetical protein
VRCVAIAGAGPAEAGQESVERVDRLIVSTSEAGRLSQVEVTGVRPGDFVSIGAAVDGAGLSAQRRPFGGPDIAPLDQLAFEAGLDTATPRRIGHASTVSPAMPAGSAGSAKKRRLRTGYPSRSPPKNGAREPVA